LEDVLDDIQTDIQTQPEKEIIVSKTQKPYRSNILKSVLAEFLALDHETALNSSNLRNFLSPESQQILIFLGLRMKTVISRHPQIFLSQKKKKWRINHKALRSYLSARESTESPTKPINQDIPVSESIEIRPTVRHRVHVRGKKVSTNDSRKVITQVQHSCSIDIQDEDFYKILNILPQHWWRQLLDPQIVKNLCEIEIELGRTPKLYYFKKKGLYPTP
jgi:hypothetical protein